MRHINLFSLVTLFTFGLLVCSSGFSSTLKGQVSVDESWGYVGIQFTDDEYSRKWIIKVFEKSPAFEVGLQRGDEIIGINGQFINNISLREASRLVQGEPNSTVSLQIRRGPKKYSAEIKRRDIRLMSKQFQQEAQ